MFGKAAQAVDYIILIMLLSKKGITVFHRYYNIDDKKKQHKNDKIL